eukprot:SAG11_NODE_1202_length_5536_cov_4.442707_3_plen_1158_part_00
MLAPLLLQLLSDEAAAQEVQAGVRASDCKVPEGHQGVVTMAQIESATPGAGPCALQDWDWSTYDAEDVAAAELQCNSRARDACADPVLLTQPDDTVEEQHWCGTVCTIEADEDDPSGYVVRGDLEVDGVGLMTQLDLAGLIRIEGDLKVQDCASLETINFAGLMEIGGEFELESVPLLTAVEADDLVTIGDDVKMEDADSVARIQFQLLETVGDDIQFEGMPVLESITLPSFVGSSGDPAQSQIEVEDCPVLTSFVAPLLDTTQLREVTFTSCDAIMASIGADGSVCNAACEIVETGGCSASGLFCDGVHVPSDMALCPSSTAEQFDAACDAAESCSFGPYADHEALCAAAPDADTCYSTSYCTFSRAEAQCLLGCDLSTCPLNVLGPAEVTFVDDESLTALAAATSSVRASACIVPETAEGVVTMAQIQSDTSGAGPCALREWVEADGHFDAEDIASAELQCASRCAGRCDDPVLLARSDADGSTLPPEEQHWCGTVCTIEADEDDPSGYVVRGDLEVDGVGLMTQLDLAGLIRIEGDLKVQDCASLETINFAGLMEIGGEFELESVPLLTAVEADDLVTIGDDVKMEDADSVARIQFQLLETVGDDIQFEGMPVLESITLPSFVGSSGDPAQSQIEVEDCPVLTSFVAPLLDTTQLREVTFTSCDAIMASIGADGSVCNAACEIVETGGCSASGLFCDGVHVPSDMALCPSSTAEQFDAACDAAESCSFGPYADHEALCAAAPDADTCYSTSYCTFSRAEAQCLLGCDLSTCPLNVLGPAEVTFVDDESLTALAAATNALEQPCVTPNGGGGDHSEACGAEFEACEADEVCAPLIPEDETLEDSEDLQALGMCVENDLCSAGMLCTMIAEDGEDCGTAQFACMAEEECRGLDWEGSDAWMENAAAVNMLEVCSFEDEGGDFDDELGGDEAPSDGGRSSAQEEATTVEIGGQEIDRATIDPSTFVPAEAPPPPPVVETVTIEAQVYTEEEKEEEGAAIEAALAAAATDAAVAEAAEAAAAAAAEEAGLPPPPPPPPPPVAKITSSMALPISTDDLAEFSVEEKTSLKTNLKDNLADKMTGASLYHLNTICFVLCSSLWVLGSWLTQAYRPTRSRSPPLPRSRTATGGGGGGDCRTTCRSSLRSRCLSWYRRRLPTW